MVSRKATKAKVVRDIAGAGDIVLVLQCDLADEEYVLDVGRQIVVRGGSYTAVSWGLATLLQGVGVYHTQRFVPCGRIQDSPYAGYRGLLIDMARHPHRLVTMKQLVTLCWFYKIRYMHLHLSDIEAFTFSSTAYPQLATPHNHLSLADWKDLEAYAAICGVILVPLWTGAAAGNGAAGDDVLSGSPAWRP